jgi:hypothetical protein
MRLAESDRVTVVRGPCAGLVYPVSELAWIDAPVAKLCGTYEQELAPIFGALGARGVDLLIDVGGADGYFAVGLPVANASLKAHVFDISASARQLCAQVANINGVAERVRISGRFSVESLRGLDLDRALLLCDIEGGEALLFDEELAALLTPTPVLIEVHEDNVPGEAERLRALFRATHDVTTIEQAPRDPASVPEISGWTPDEQSFALAEFRPLDLLWLWCEPRASGHPAA